ncbi:disintegrin and metalloproteinase domain-containing protein 2-like [Terrapene carolina triunguis]|uniref:disintegrin and metalloproteinase domain-containing protein 2-like n=1 Tax=Terrapene triunguis TaxID=2587831 RepID=UPI001156A668|nr:disintegrin and metalloproteinase domain-containing protein 2-like [Terrapene carolina triunguis]
MGPVLALLLAHLLPALAPLSLTLQVREEGRGLVESQASENQVSYVITIEERSYTLHLKQQVFLPNNFRVYTYSQEGSVHSNFPHIKRDCFYKGYIAGFPNSVVTLSTCSGLRGILQLKNVSYGIEPLDSTPGFQHLVYQIWNENIESLLFVENDSVIWSEGMTRKLDTGIKYDYMGSDKDVVTEKIVQLIGFVNSMFTPLNMTIVLSSLEFWADSNKIPTTGEADELLRRFLQWKNIHLILRPHDIAYLFVYRDQPNYVGASFAGKLCLRNYSGGVALYQRTITLETFSVIIAQLLGLSLGIAYDDSRDCQCSGYTCIMHTKAVHSSGTKAFSNCSIGDFQSFIANGEGECLLNKPYLNASYRAPVCGNKKVEEGEDCDCGTRKHVRKKMGRRKQKMEEEEKICIGHKDRPEEGLKGDREEIPAVAPDAPVVHDEGRKFEVAVTEKLVHTELVQMNSTYWCVTTQNHSELNGKPCPSRHPSVCMTIPRRATLTVDRMRLHCTLPMTSNLTWDPEWHYSSKYLEEGLQALQAKIEELVAEAQRRIGESHLRYTRMGRPWTSQY